MFIPQTLNLSPPRTNDRTIMEVIIHNKHHGNIIEQLNICRQYLRIIYISDMTTPDGVYINNESLQMIPNSSSYHWPHIPKPPNKLCQLWISTIQKIFCEKRTNN